MTTFSKHTHSIKWIRSGDISVVWQRAQRNFDPRKAKDIADNFDPDVFGTIYATSVDNNGVYHCIDGQHRIGAVRQLFGDDEKVPVYVLQATDPQRAAEMFMKINFGRTRPCAVDLFNVGVTAGQPDNVALNKLLTGLGYKVRQDHADGSIRAIDACRRVFRRYGEQITRDAFLVIQGMWGRVVDATDGSIVAGVALFLSKYPDADKERLVARTVKQYTPARLIGAARTAREMFRGDLASNVCRTLTATYNLGLRKGRLGEEGEG